VFQVLERALADAAAGAEERFKLEAEALRERRAAAGAADALAVERRRVEAQAEALRLAERAAAEKDDLVGELRRAVTDLRLQLAAASDDAAPAWSGASTRGAVVNGSSGSSSSSGSGGGSDGELLSLRVECASLRRRLAQFSAQPSTQPSSPSRAHAQSSALVRAAEDAASDARAHATSVSERERIPPTHTLTRLKRLDSAYRQLFGEHFITT